MSVSNSESIPGDRVFIMERELQNLKLKISMLQEFSDNLKQQLQESEAALQKSRHEYYEVLQVRDNLKHDLDDLREEVDKLKDEKIEMFELLKKKNLEITTLKDTLHTIQSNDVLDVEKSKNSSLNEIKLRFLDSRFKDEKNLYQNQIQLLNQELENKTTELLNIRKENNERILEANMKIEDQASEIGNMKLEINRLKKLNESKDSKNEELSNKLLELQIHCTKLESTYNKETEAQNEIISLLVKNNEEKEKESQQKNENIAELRELLQKGLEAHNELELQFQSMKEDYIKDVKELEEERQKLMDELEQAKLGLLEFNTTTIEKQFEKYFPFAAETNRKLNNVVNLSDLYDELVHTKQELTRVMTINLKLEKELKELNEKVDEDKPLLYKNIHEYELIEQNYDKLNVELMRLLMEKDKYMSEKDKDTQMINTLKREIKRYQQETDDLSLQIAYLMKNVQEAKCFQVSSDPTFFESSTQQSNLPNGLILFKDIQELQEKNRQLLALLHQMNDELQNKDVADGDDARESQLKSEIDTLKNEMENLRNELNQKNEIIELTSKQKRLINPNYSSDYVDPVEIITENKELKTKLHKYMEDLDNTRKRNLEDIRRLETDKNNLIQENATVKSDLSRLNSELQTQKSYMEEVNLTMEKYQNENVLLRERNIKLNNLTENLEKNIINLKNQIDHLNEAIKIKDSNLEFCKAELLQVKNNMDYLIKENERLTGEVKNQLTLVQSMKIMQENCTKVENDTIRNQSSQIERLEKEIAYYREKIQKQEEKWKETIESFSTRFHNLQEMLDKERNKYLQLQQEHYEMKIKSQQQQQKRSVGENTTDISEQPETDISVSVPTVSFSSGNVKKELQMCQDEIKILKGKLANSEEKCQNLQSINVALEKNLNKLVENNQEIKTNIDSEIQNKLNTINQLNQDLQTMREQYEKIVSEKDNKIEQLKHSTDDFTKQLQKLQIQLDDMKQALEKAHKNEREVLNDIKIQSIIAAKAQQDYENAIELRNKDAKTIFELQVKLDNTKKQLTDQESETEKLLGELKANVEILENERKSFSQECEKLKIRCGTLEQVNDSLSNQIEQLNNQIIALQNNSNIFMLDENQQKENANRLLSVVKFLREEKAQLQLEISRVNDENMCLKIEIENYKGEIENLKSMLQMEKESSNRLNNLNEFKEIVAKAQMLPVLNENNTQLKIQVGHLEKKCNELLEKINSLESKEKSLKDLSHKSEEEEFQVEFLRREVDNWKSKANALSQQLKNFDAESVKRLMNEKSSLNKQVQMNNTEMTRLKHDLENKTRSLLINEQELNSIRQQLKQVTDQRDNLSKEFMQSRNEFSNLQNVNAQLRSLARKYKAEISKIKSSAPGGSNGGSGKTSESAELSDKEVQCDLKPVETTNIQQQENKGIDQQLKEYETKVENLTNDVQRLNDENESLKKHASDKDEIAKKIAQQAKQRISDLSLEKANLIKEKENLAKSVEELKSKVLKLENNAEQYVSKLKSQYDSQITQQQKELQTANKQIEDLTSQLKQPTSVTISKPSNIQPFVQPITTHDSLANKSTNSTTLTTPPVRHSVLPQQQPSTSSTTLVFSSAKPTPTVSIKPMTVSVPPNYRFGQVFGQKIVPTESTSASSVPQATVQPTQAVSISNASSTSVSSSSIASTSHQTDVEVSEAATSSQTHLSNISKRALENTSFDEPSSSNYKKSKTTSSSHVHVDESDDEDQISPNDRGPEEMIRDQYDDFVLEGSQGGQDDDEDFHEDTESQVKEITDEEAEEIENELNNESNEVDEMMEEEDELVDEEEDEDEDEDEEEMAEEDNLEDDQDNDDDARTSDSAVPDEEEDDNDDGNDGSGFICLEDEEDEEEDDDEVDEEETDENKIEVIELHSDSSEDEQVNNFNNDNLDLNQAKDENNVSEVTSSHVSSMALSNQTLRQQDHATTTHEDSNEAPVQTNPSYSSATNVVTSQSSSTVSDSEAVITSQTCSATSHPQQNTSELASSSTSSTTSTSVTSQQQNSNRFQRRPVLWTDNPNRNTSNQQQQQQHRGAVIQHGQHQHRSQINQQIRGHMRNQRNLRRGINRNRRNFRF